MPIIQFKFISEIKPANQQPAMPPTKVRFNSAIQFRHQFISDFINSVLAPNRNWNWLKSELNAGMMPNETMVTAGIKVPSFNKLNPDWVYFMR